MLLHFFSRRFIRTLVNFYKPSSRQFYAIQYSEANAKKYSAAGLELIKFLNQKDQVFLHDTLGIVLREAKCTCERQWVWFRERFEQG